MFGDEARQQKMLSFITHKQNVLLRLEKLKSVTKKKKEKR